MKHVIGLSGGMDSATLLGYLLEQGSEQVTCCSFYYGSKHGLWEGLAAKNIVNFYQAANCPVRHQEFNICGVFEGFKSNLLQSGGEIPEGHYEHESMSKTVVPGRNLILASIMAGLAESIEADFVALGVHSGDHHIYPDCRPEFIRYLADTVNSSSDNQVQVIAPFLDLDKTKILKLGYSFDTQVPYHLTRTCYKDQPHSCGKCGSCTERLEAFANIGRPDPVKYE